MDMENSQESMRTNAMRVAVITAGRRYNRIT
jgi:hypothetical protein